MKKALKIGILTQPLQDNYGGLLQAYALKEVLKDLGHEVTIIDRRAPRRSRVRIIASNIKQKIKRTNQRALTQSEVNTISQNTNSFKRKYIPEVSDLITSHRGMKALNNRNFDAFIVGSDQCWRPLYSPKITNYFLDFVKDNTHIKRISYAASFGTSSWEFNRRETQRCKKLLRKFDAISVREKSGVTLVSSQLGRSDVYHVLDPTMLLSTKHYKDIAIREGFKSDIGTLKVYVLDKSQEKDDFINMLEKQLNLRKFEVMPRKRLKDGGVRSNNIDQFQFPSPAMWLKGFDSAEFVITDSFHGTVFSILFNKPFITIANKKRGIARFESILNTLGLSERLVTDIREVDVNQIINSPIDWDVVNRKLSSERENSMNFIRKSLK